MFNSTNVNSITFVNLKVSMLNFHHNYELQRKYSVYYGFVQLGKYILPSSAQSSAQLKLSLSSIFAVRPPSGIRNPESAIRNPPSAIRKSIISNLILATAPKLQPLPSNLQPQLKLILPSPSSSSAGWLS